MMENNRQFTLMHDAIQEKLAVVDPVALSKRTGFSWKDGELEATTFGTKIRISFPNCEISPALEPWHQLTILQYLANSQGTPLSGSFLSLSDFRSGGMARGTSFDRENDRIFHRIGNFSIDAIQEAANAIGDIELSEKADLTFLFSFLPRVPIKLCLWLADEDFPASGKVLFDTSAESDLQVEAAGTAAGILLSMLEKQLEHQGTAK